MKTVGVSLYEKYCFMTFSELFRIANFLRLVVQTHSENWRIQEIVQIFIKLWEKNSENYHLWSLFTNFFTKVFSALQRNNQCFQHFQSRKYSNNMCMSNILRLAWQTNSATHVWWQIKSTINIAIFKIATRKKLISKRLVSCNLVFI